MSLYFNIFGQRPNGLLPKTSFSLAAEHLSCALPRVPHSSLSVSLPSSYFYPSLLFLLLLSLLMCLLPQELMRKPSLPLFPTSSSSLQSSGTLSERQSSRLETWLAMSRLNYEPGANAHVAIQTHYKQMHGTIQHLPPSLPPSLIPSLPPSLSLSRVTLRKVGTRALAHQAPCPQATHV